MCAVYLYVYIYIYYIQIYIFIEYIRMTKRNQFKSWSQLQIESTNWKPSVLLEGWYKLHCQTHQVKNVFMLNGFRLNRESVTVGCMKHWSLLPSSLSFRIRYNHHRQLQWVSIAVCISAIMSSFICTGGHNASHY